jgi:hypothetical protein
LAHTSGSTYHEHSRFMMRTLQGTPNLENKRRFEI